MPTSARPITRCTPGRARGPCPTKISCRAAPMCAAVQRTSCNVSLRGRTAPVAIRTSRQRSCLRRLPFFLRRKKERKERRQNQWFWNPFRGQDTARSGTLQPRELNIAKFAPCFRIVSASPSATRSALVLACPGGDNLCVYRPGRCGHLPLHLFIMKPSVGADAHIGPSAEFPVFIS